MAGRAGDADAAILRPVSEEARRLASRWEAGINLLARRISRESFGDLPGYRDLPDDMVDVEIAEAVRQGLRVFAQVARGEATAATAEAYRLFRQRAGQRAHEGLPLPVLVHAHLGARQEMWKVLRDLAEPGEECALLELADLLFAALPADLSEVVTAYLTEQDAPGAVERNRRRSLALSLLHGSELSREEWDVVGFPNGALVVVVRPPEAKPDRRRGAVAGQRLERLWQQRLDRSLGADALVLLDDDLGYVLLSRVDDRQGRLPAEVTALLAGADGTALPAAVDEAADRTGLAEAATRARDVLGLALALGRGPGPHRMRDVLLEYHLSHPGRGTAALVTLLDPVLARPELAEAVRGYVAHQQDRRATAQVLGLHPNTVDNRVRRAGALLGTDLTTPHGYALVLAALAARGLLGTPPTHPPTTC